MVWKSSFSIFVLLFFVWLVYSINSNYLPKPTASSVSIKQRDNGDKSVQFPTIVYCKKFDGTILWKNGSKCKTNPGDLKPPYYLNYIHDCLDCKKIMHFHYLAT